jgi:hypothetical protein
LRYDPSNSESESSSSEESEHAWYHAHSDASSSADEQSEPESPQEEMDHYYAPWHGLPIAGESWSSSNHSSFLEYGLLRDSECYYPAEPSDFEIERARRTALSILEHAPMKHESPEDAALPVDLDVFHREWDCTRPSPEELLDAGDVMPPIGMIHEPKDQTPEEAW